MSIIVKDSEILAQNEIEFMLKEQRELLDSAINKWGDTIDAHIGKMFSDEKRKVHFFAKITCQLCNKEHFTDNLDRVQYQGCMHFIAANIVNSCCGLAPDQSKIEALEAQLNTETDETLKKTIQATIDNEKNVFQLKYVCNECATFLQKEFRKVLEQKIRDIGIKNFI